MLVLSRKRDEKITIGDNINIQVVEIRGDKVRLGIEAPKEIPVHRKEIYDAIRERKRDAAAAGLEAPAPGEFNVEPGAPKNEGHGSKPKSKQQNPNNPHSKIKRLKDRP